MDDWATPGQEFDPAWVDYLIAARRGGPRRWRLDEADISETAGYAAQEALVRQLGAVAGWKVGSASAIAQPSRSAFTAATLRTSPARLRAQDFTVVGIEAELVFVFGRDLPPRANPYSRSEVVDAVTTVHAGIEVIDTRYSGWGIADRGSQIADQLNHGLLVIGDGVQLDSDRDWARSDVALRLNGEVVRATQGGNTAGDPVRLLVWLANEGSLSLGGLTAGAAVTTGSCTGSIFVGGGTTVEARFAGVGSAALEIARTGGG